MSKVSLEKIKKSYDKNEIIKGVDLEIQDKEFLVLVGPSGCGKSTLLRIIAGLEDVTEGKVFIGDKDVTHLHPKDRDIAMVFQNYALYPHMSVYDNMAFALKMRKVPKNEIDEKVKEAAQILDLTQYLERKPSQLSGGQRQRVALGRAIVRNPKVFLMDEPLSNLDAKLRSSTRFEIKKLHKKLDTTFIYVTHDQVEAMTMGDRIAVLHQGKLQQLGSAQEIYANPKNTFVAGFIGSPSMNFIKGEIKSNRFLAPNIDIEANFADQNAILGIRPEDLILDKNGQITSTVDLVEMLGSEKLLHFKFNNTNIIAKVTSDVAIEHGDEIKLSPNLEKIVFFNKETTENLRG
jgi:multiple sugar transport system ATP-binding protein